MQYFIASEEILTAKLTCTQRSRITCYPSKTPAQSVAVGAGADVTPEMLEGEWPNNLFNYIIRWPCAKAAKDFWYSDGYQNKALPIRKDAGDFTIALFPAG